MVVLHLENNEITQVQLSDLLGVKDKKLNGHDYVPTQVVVAAEDDLRHNRVVALVLDLGLDNPWDNAHKLAEELKHAVAAPAAWTPPVGLKAYQVATLARGHRVPFAILTNYANLLGLPADECLKRLTQAFGADAAFGKDGAGLKQCADWVRRTIARVPPR